MKAPPTSRWIAVTLVCIKLPLFAAGAVTAHPGKIELPTYPWAAVKHPYFRETDKLNIYPYPMIDFLSREKTNRTYRTVVLENEYLRITFLPELGGKIHEVLDKTTGQPMFYVNHVVKPDLIAQCGAWTSGGVEWNTGPQGHTVSCMQPVEVRILPPAKDGSRSVAIGETERIYGTKWTVVVTLRPGRSFIEERIRIYNPTETIRPYYFWNCTASPNTAGFRFIYPMTLGMDHSGEKFFHWPIDEGKNLTYGTNYQDASSIFAYRCDQDFFGSYNDDLGRGVVSYANHHQVPGKKAWTWGHGSYGTMHQADLTDTDGPYNEVQTGPLLTQGEVGRLDPCEAVEWQEWWYPIHGTDGFTFANKNVAVNAEIDNGRLRLRMIGSGTWTSARVNIKRGGNSITEASCDLSPSKLTDLALPLEQDERPLDIMIVSKNGSIAEWRFPLPLPERKVPQKRPSAKDASEFAQSGWEEFRFGHFSVAEDRFRKALQKDPKCLEAHLGLAHVFLSSSEPNSADESRAAIATDPDYGPARFVLAVAESRLGHRETALEEAWKAALDPATAVPARSLIGKLLIQQGRFDEAIEALSEPGPWQTDSLCRNRLALALRLIGKKVLSNDLARLNLDVDPLDDFAQSLLWFNSGRKAPDQLGGKVAVLLEQAAQYTELGRRADVFEMLDKLYVHWPARRRNPLLDEWYLESSTNRSVALAALEQTQMPARAAGAEDLPNLWPHHYEVLPILQQALKADPQDGYAALSVGNLLFHLGRYSQAYEMWRRAAALDASSTVALRALGMAARTHDGDLGRAREFLEKACATDQQDPIVARDLASVLAALADKTDSQAEKHTLLSTACDRLKTAFIAGKTRADFIALLAREQNQLGQFAETARLLDSVRVTVWEGGHELHDLFEQAHLELGDAALKAGRPAEGLAEFNRALDYPANLATGHFENAPEAHIHYRRGNALAALGRTDEALTAWKQAADAPASSDPRVSEARENARKRLERPRNLGEKSSSVAPAQ
ncbi:MAG TPA: DUF5107 domain-containing protein [Patescibacteria group bacterium]|nr:DUF5107 domain-containing protein [Patescibacteria group bacterium]